MNKEYWENFYSKQNAELKPSLFARFVVENFAQGKKNLIELGCGNGRDAIFFANEGFSVSAIDQCEGEIEFLKSKYKNLPDIDFLCDDFTKLKDSEKFDIIYSRFTLHSITADCEKRLLPWVYKNLAVGGFFCVEVRGKKNEIYQKGEPVEGEKDAFIYNDHFRRFLDFDELKTSLSALGFQIEYADEKKGFAPFKGDDETYIRVIAKK